MLSLVSPVGYFIISSISGLLAVSHSEVSVDPAELVSDQDPLERAGLASKSLPLPGFIPVLALSVVAITMVRRRIRQ